MEYIAVAGISICAWEAGKQVAGLITRWWEDTWKGFGA